MFISKSELTGILTSLSSLNIMGKNSDVRIDTLCGNIVVAEKDIEKIREDIKTIFVAVNRTNDDVYDVNEIIKKTKELVARKKQFKTGRDGNVYIQK